MQQKIDLQSPWHSPDFSDEFFEFSCYSQPVNYLPLPFLNRLVLLFFRGALFSIDFIF